MRQPCKCDVHLWLSTTSFLHFIGSNCGPTKSYSLASQIEQLQQMSDAIRTALTTVTSLEFTINYQGYKIGINMYDKGPLSRETWIVDRNINRPCASSDMTEEAQSALAALLASTVPNICHLGVGGAVGEVVMRKLGVMLHKLTSLEVLDGNFSVIQGVPVDNGPPQGPLLPRLSHLKMLQTMLDWHTGQVERVQQLLDCPLITHLELQEEWLTESRHLLILPVGIKVLVCGLLPLVFATCRVPPQLHLMHLHTIQLAAGECVQRLTVSNLVSLLAAAPCLSSLSVLNSGAGTCLVVKACERRVIDSAHVLHQRMEAGFAMEGVKLYCWVPLRGGTEEVPEFLPLEQVLSRLPHFPTFRSCTLEHGEGQRMLGCLSSTARTFPSLEVLMLKGAWTEAELDLDVVFKFLKVLELKSVDVTSQMLLRLFRSAPSLTTFQVSSCIAQGWREVLQATMKEAQVMAADNDQGCGGQPHLSNWTLMMEGSKKMIWKRATDCP